MRSRTLMSAAFTRSASNSSNLAPQIFHFESHGALLSGPAVGFCLPRVYTIISSEKDFNEWAFGSRWRARTSLTG